MILENSLRNLLDLWNTPEIKVWFLQQLCSTIYCHDQGWKIEVLSFNPRVPEHGTKISQNPGELNLIHLNSVKTNCFLIEGLEFLQPHLCTWSFKGQSLPTKEPWACPQCHPWITGLKTWSILVTKGQKCGGLMEAAAEILVQVPSYSTNLAGNIFCTACSLQERNWKQPRAQNRSGFILCFLFL